MKILEFAFPADCVMLTDAAGKRIGDSLQITCIIHADPGRKLELNGIPCVPSGNKYTVKVLLTDQKNTLTVRDTETGECVSITVYYLKNATAQICSFTEAPREIKF